MQGATQPITAWVLRFQERVGVFDQSGKTVVTGAQSPGSDPGVFNECDRPPIPPFESVALFEVTRFGLAFPDPGEVLAVRGSRGSKR